MALRTHSVSAGLISRSPTVLQRGLVRWAHLGGHSSVHHVGIRRNCACSSSLRQLWGPSNVGGHFSAWDIQECDVRPGGDCHLHVSAHP